ncbi:MAG: hypothetical protein R2838_03595 [Caldilineaceae bacterium]
MDENPATAERFTVMGLPTLLFLRDGVEVGRQVGLLTYEALQQQVTACCGRAPGVASTRHITAVTPP